MAGGPLGWESAEPADVTGEIFPHTHITSAGRHIHGLGVAAAADLTANRIWDLIFQMPETGSLPTGTLKLRVRSMTAGTGTDDVTLDPDWRSADPSGFDPDGSLNSEGTTVITFAGADVFVETKIDLDAGGTPPAAGETLLVRFQINDTGTDLAAISVHLVDIIWE